MDIKGCPECGKIFVDTGAGLCLECLKREEEQYDIVHKFLSKNPNVSIDYVCSETGVEKEKIMKFLRQGRLLQANLSGVELRCSICGCVIASGTLCDACLNKLKGAAGDLGPSDPSSRQPGRMHTFERIRNR